ncbi:MAG: hypothetical protein H8E89_06395 [Candidatus Nitrosopelagicus sp.]|nr:hypothetical protein [Candidatus Nitrosopelagicus sp.]|tara:strand:+ start:1112 stop:1468 length:357 start_codon:yes stop_codon:yes gene_type:complete
MQVSSPRFKSLAVTAGLSFWFFIITSSTGVFSILYFVLFVGILLTITQIFAKKLSKGLDIFATFNTKIFLGALYIFVISIYGILFKLLGIDLLRIKKQKQKQSYWLEVESSNDVRKMF